MAVKVIEGEGWGSYVPREEWRGPAVKCPQCGFMPFVAGFGGCGRKECPAGPPVEIPTEN